MEPLTRVLAATVVAACAIAAGCNGSIGGAGGAGNATGMGTGTGNGTGTGTGTGNATGVGGAGAGATGVAGSGVITAPAAAGVVVMRRLNHSEYNNTVKELLGTTLAPANGFPADDLGGEFDTVGSALSLSPAYVIAYEAAATALVADLYAGDAARRQRVVSCNVDTGGDACAQTILGAFARRAWRRPVTSEEVASLMKPVTTARTVGLTPTDGIKYALTAVLLSPHFVFKVEIDPDPASTQSRRVSPHELATRMSYALWASMPDAVLSMAADSGQLATDEQIRRADRPDAGRSARGRAARRVRRRMAGLQAARESRRGHQALPAVHARAGAFDAARSAALRPGVPAYRAGGPGDAELAVHVHRQRAGDPLRAHAQRRRGGRLRPRRYGERAARRPVDAGRLSDRDVVTTRTSPVKRGEFIFWRLLCGTIDQPPPDVPPMPEAGQGG